MAKELTPEEEIALIRKKLGYLTLEQTPSLWLDTKSAKLNAVLGSPEKGVAYGRIVELHGWESHGKSLLAMLLARQAQRDGAKALWVDYEGSFDLTWAAKQGIAVDKLLVLHPQIGKFKGEPEARLQTAQETCKEVEEWMRFQHSRNVEKMIVVTDSVTAMLVEDEAIGGIDEQNMRTNVAQATFLSRLLKRWVGYSHNYNALMLFINQLRTRPGVRFGNPEYTTGGNALRLYASVRVSVRRAHSGKMMQGGKIIGLRGVMTNVKNKVGGGSLEGQTCGFETVFEKGNWRFMPKEQAMSAEKATK